MFVLMSSNKMIAVLVLALCGVCLADSYYESDYDSPYNANSEDESSYEDPQSLHDTPSTGHQKFRQIHSQRLFHREQPLGDHQSDVQSDKPQKHNHDHGTSSMSFYQKVKHQVHKFKFAQKHGKHGHYHGYAYPYAYGGLKVEHY